jgi:hypothetical protein
MLWWGQGLLDGDRLREIVQTAIEASLVAGVLSLRAVPRGFFAFW